MCWDLRSRQVRSAWREQRASLRHRRGRGRSEKCDGHCHYDRAAANPGHEPPGMVRLTVHRNKREVSTTSDGAGHRCTRRSPGARTRPTHVAHRVAPTSRRNLDEWKQCAPVSNRRSQELQAARGAIFPRADRPGRALRAERLQQVGDEEPAAEAGLQVAHEDDRSGRKLDPTIADVVASAMKDWAIEKGATTTPTSSIPLTGLTAEKHDSFLVARWRRRRDRRVHRQAADPGRARRARASPPAASAPRSKPAATRSGTSPARPTSWKTRTARRSAFPTAFVSWTGEALDKKTPLLRSMQALNKQAKRILKLFGHDGRGVRRVDRRPRAGILPDRPPLLLRPARPAHRRPHAVRRQAAQGPGVRRPLLRRHSRARAGLHARSRARAVQARHSGEDAPQRSGPGQYEIAPVFESANLATDHQQLIMITLQARGREVRHGVPARTKSRSPASTARASTSTGRSAAPSQGNLLDPGDTPHENAQFLVFCAAVIRAVHKYQRSAAGRRGHGRQRSPPGCERSPAGDHLDLPRRPAHRRVRADQEGRRELVARRRRAR